jgi:hypothetical protein
LPTNPFGQSSKSTTDNSHQDYDLKIRGLNKSFVESAQKLLERSPAADFSKLFLQYSKHLASFSVNLSAEEKKTKTFDEPVAANINSKAAFEPVKTFEFSKPVEKPTEKFFELPKPVDMPKFSEPSRPVELSKPNEISKPLEFISKTFEIPAAKPFEFKPMPSVPVVEVVKKDPEIIEVNESESESASEIETKTEAPKFSFSFGAAATATAPVIEKTAEKIAEKDTTFTPFSFGSATATTTEPVKAFSFGTPAAVNETAAFKGFSFGASATETSTAASTTESSTPFKSFSFGSTVEAPKLNVASTSVLASVDSSATAPIASNSFSFGGSSSTFSFGVPATTQATATETKQPDTSAPKFSFGSSTIGGLAPLPTFSFGAPSNSGFSFNIPAATAAAPAGKTGEQSDDGGDEIPAEEAESFSLTRTNTEQLKTGAGEENETCQHEQRCKVFMMDSVGSWADLGVGIFKINRYNNEIGKSRVLCRSEGNGKVILNALVSVPGMNVSNTEGKKEVALLAIGPESKLVKYLIRVKTLEQANELKMAILNEIEYVKNGKNSN